MGFMRLIPGIDTQTPTPTRNGRIAAPVSAVTVLFWPRTHASGARKADVPSSH